MVFLFIKQIEVKVDYYSHIVILNNALIHCKVIEVIILIVIEFLEQYLLSRFRFPP